MSSLGDGWMDGLMRCNAMLCLRLSTPASVLHNIDLNCAIHFKDMLGNRMV
jgi:hypothetical protein